MKCKHLLLWAKAELQNNKKGLYSAICETCNLTCTHWACYGCFNPSQKLIYQVHYWWYLGNINQHYLHVKLKCRTVLTWSVKREGVSVISLMLDPPGKHSLLVLSPRNSWSCLLWRKLLMTQLTFCKFSK